MTQPRSDAGTRRQRWGGEGWLNSGRALKGGQQSWPLGLDKCNKSWNFLSPVRDSLLLSEQSEVRFLRPRPQGTCPYP